MKKMFIILLIVLLIIGMTACYSEQELAEKDEWLCLGTEAMEEYLQDKYNISPNLESTEVLKAWISSLQPYISADYIPMVAAEFIVDGETYQICADVSNAENIKCYDNYESEKIKKIILGYINGLTGTDVYKDEISFSEHFENKEYIEKQMNLNEDNLVNKKIDNIDDILSLAKGDDTIFCGSFYYVGVENLNIYKSDLDTLKKVGNFEFISLKTEIDAYRAFTDNKNVSKIIPNICDYIIISEGDVTNFDKNNVSIKNGLIFYNEHGINVQTIVTEDEKTYFVNDNYDCYIPQSQMPDFEDGVKVVIMGTNLNGQEVVLYTFNKSIYEQSEYDKYYIFNNSNSKKDEYKYWYITTQTNS